jgi:hypothetical protein
MSSLYIWKQEVYLESYVGICTDGAPSVVGSIIGFASLVKQENSYITAHCFIHRKVLVSKTLGDEMKKVLDNATKMVKFIKQRPVQSRIFKNFVKSWKNNI